MTNLTRNIWTVTTTMDIDNEEYTALSKNMSNAKHLTNSNTASMAAMRLLSIYKQDPQDNWAIPAKLHTRFDTL
jgi:hypothetical protein